MAELFNPFNRRVTGEAFNGMAPVQLRVEEGSASRDQVRATQDAFARFARRATFSHVPNPAESGVLGDGSPYRITTVGNTTIVQLWPVQQNPSLFTLRGISFILRAMDGSALPEHSTPAGDPVNYVLTPLVDRVGERIANGRFKISRPKVVQGGQLVSRSAKGDFYMVGGGSGGDVHAYGDRHYRERHYTAISEQLINTTRGQNEPGSGIRDFAYSTSKRLAVDGDFAFIHTTVKGALYLMGLSYEPLYAASGLPAGTRITLHVRPYRKNPSAPVQTRIFRADIAVNIYPPSTTFSRDGSKAKAHYGNLGAAGVASMQLSVNGLTVTTLDKVQPRTEVAEQGAQTGDNYSYTRTTSNHSGDLGDYFNRLGAEVGRTSYVGEEVYSSTQSYEVQSTSYSKPTGDVDQDGNPVYADYFDTVETTISSSSISTSTSAGGAYLGGKSQSLTQWHIVRSEIGRRFGIPGIVEMTRSYSTSSQRSAVSRVFLDDALTDTNVSLVRTASSSDAWTDYNGPDGAYEKTQGPQSSSLQYHFVVRHRGQIVQRDWVPEYATDWDASLLDYSFGCSVAQDVDTDCLLISITKNYKGKPIDAWAYLAGQRFIKPLGDVLRYSAPARLDANFMTV